VQARISLRAGGLQPGAQREGGPEFEDLFYFFLLVLKISPAAPFDGLPFHENLLSGHFPQKFRVRRRLTFIFISYACPGGPKKQAARAREDLNPALIMCEEYTLNPCIQTTRQLPCSIIDSVQLLTSFTSGVYCTVHMLYVAT
jgi:hypothetical protein